VRIHICAMLQQKSNNFNKLFLCRVVQRRLSKFVESIDVITSRQQSLYLANVAILRRKMQLLTLKPVFG